MARCLHGMDKSFCETCTPSRKAVVSIGARHPRPITAKTAEAEDAPINWDSIPTPYATIEEASEAVQRIPEITSAYSYWQHRHRDPRLPRRQPDTYYGRKAWKRIGKWSGFTGRNKKEEKQAS